MNQKDKTRLLMYITEVSFAVLDCTLYLDTHPYDEEALEYYHKYRKLREEALEEYQCHFGPLLNTDNTNKNKWQWVEGPWPWEGGC